MRRRRWLAAGLAGAAVAVVLVVAWVSGLLFADSARPAPPGVVVARFRAADPHPRPLDGVYRYRTSGGESLDVLGGKRHRYPATTTITVVEVPCGLRLRWDALAGRSTTWTLCTRARLLRALDEVHTFFGRTDRTSYACIPQAGGRFHCRSQHGTEDGRQSTVRSGGTLRVHLSARVGGGDRGVETTDWSLDARTGLPLELVVSSRTSRPEPLVGQAHYSEDARLRLASRSPQR